MTLESTHRDRHSSSLQSGSGIGENLGGAIARKLVSMVVCGRLTIVTPGGTVIESPPGQPGPEGTMILHNWRGFRRLFLQGDLGFARGYLDNDWSSPDLAGLIGVADRNYDALTRYIDGYTLLRLANLLRHKLRANSKRGSRKNIEAHYDLGNDFYKLWLDPTMTYSSAIFASENEPLEEAQQRKIDRIVELMNVPKGGSALEIGCGWGALSRAIAGAGAGHVVGLTLSPSQRAHALAAIRGTDLEQKTDIRLQDYRDTTGTFDRLVSIEMIEAVGEEYWPVYFKTIHDRLVDGGHAIVQAITISEKRYEAYRSSVDFIQRYIFPGGMLPTPTIISEQAKNAGLKATCAETFGQSYARTLEIWRQRFHAQWASVAQLGFDERFKRMWEYYLAYCEAGFRNGTIDVGLYKLERPSRS
jgi:cyclopropane-fatty-acyl-phospholipid synthase